MSQKSSYADLLQTLRNEETESASQRAGERPEAIAEFVLLALREANGTLGLSDVLRRTTQFGALAASGSLRKMQENKLITGFDDGSAEIRLTTLGDAAAGAVSAPRAAS